MTPSEETFHVHRKYQTAPYVRWAFDVVEDPSTDVGFRITAFDHKVADAHYVAQFERHVSSSIQVRDGGLDETHGYYESFEVLEPGDEGYFESAMHQIPNGLIKATGEEG